MQTVGQTVAEHDARMKWWREARFGLFIHWGLYAIPASRWNGQLIGGAGEWIMQTAPIPVADYETLAARFDPEKFDAGAWAKLARTAGMKYVVVTAKHHDGFALYDSKASRYDIVDATPYRRDCLRALADAVRREGLTMGWYYSIADWHHPDAQGAKFPNYDDRREAGANPNFHRYVREKLTPQVRELLTEYGPIGVMWFDGEWIPEWTEPQGRQLQALCRSFQPNIIVNNRVGKGRRGMQGMSRDASFAGDFGTPEQEVPPMGFAPGVNWESCMTMNDTWGFKTDDHAWKSERELIRTLIDVASKGGNFLLNVGPTAAGEIPRESVLRLAAIGRWMDTNGQAIYGTSASPFESLPFGRATYKRMDAARQRPDMLYLHVFDWPADASLILPMRTTVKRAWLLAVPPRTLTIESGDRGVRLGLGGPAPDPAVSVVALELNGPVVAIR